jgi:sugar-specific transcriptional regulator TrmB
MHRIKDNKLFNIEEAGFSDKEAAVYLATLEVGRGSVMEIAKIAKVERTTTYRILQSFLPIPLVQTFKENKKTRWAALHPRYLVDYVQKKKNAIHELFPELEALYNLNEEKPKLAYFEGEEGLGQLTANIIKEVKVRGELLSFSAPGAASGYYTTKRFLQFAQERAKKQIMSRILIPTIEGIPDYKVGEDWKNWRHVKIVDPEKFPFKASFNIWNNKVAILTVRTHPIGVVIDSKDISDTLRSIFEMVWRQIKD